MKKILRRLKKPRWLYLLWRKLIPLSPKYGMERGQPVDRYYIDLFLSHHADSIRGKCLEVRDNRYTGRFASQITHADILDIDTANTEATIHADLRSAPQIPDNTYDCLILTQVFQYIDDVTAALRECYRILKPGGVLLAVVPAMARLDPKIPEYWRFTADGMRRLLGTVFSEEHTTVTGHGNVLVGTGFWIGQAAEEFSKKELDYNDQNFSIIITICA